MASHSELEIRHLRAFVTLVERGRVTAAARALERAQSTISESLAALERTLGAELVVRGRGSDPIRLTKAGEALLPHAHAVLAAVDNAHVAVAAATTSARGSVQIVANESTSTYLLPEALAGLRKRWPMIRFLVSVAACSSVRQRVADGTFDVGLLLKWDSEADDGSILLLAAPIVLFARPSHPLAQRASGRAIPRADVLGFRVFITDSEGDFHAALHRFLMRNRLGTPILEATGSVEGVKRAVIGDGSALGLLPAFAVAEELRLGSFVRFDVRPALPGMHLAAKLSRRRPLHPAIEALIRVLQQPTRTSAIRRIS